MTDVLIERLARANPVPPTAVSNLSAQLRAQAPDLPERSRRSGSSRRVLLIAAAIATAAVLAVPALAWRFGVIDFSNAKTAPPHLVKEFASLSEAAPPGMDPRVVAGETRRVGELAGHTLWVAPTKAGGLCYLWSAASGGCDALGTVPLGVSWLSAEPPFSPNRSFVSVDGFAHARWVDEVLVKLDDGSTAHPRVIWISPPIDAGFFYFRAPAERKIVTVLGRKEGEITTADTTGAGTPPGPHPFADLAKRSRITEIRTDDGLATLWTAPTKTEGRCTWLEFQSREIPVVPCLPKGYERQAALAYAVHRLGGTAILAGECGYSAVELIHRDGSVRTVRCKDGLLFATLEPADVAGEIQAIAGGKRLPGSRGPVARAIAQG
jgi:hypothetical protein